MSSSSIIPPETSVCLCMICLDPDRPLPSSNSSEVPENASRIDDAAERIFQCPNCSNQIHEACAAAWYKTCWEKFGLNKYGFNCIHCSGDVTDKALDVLERIFPGEISSEEDRLKMRLFSAIQSGENNLQELLQNSQNKGIWNTISLVDILYFDIRNHYIDRVKRIIENDVILAHIPRDKLVDVFFYVTRNSLTDIVKLFIDNTNYWNHLSLAEQANILCDALEKNYPEIVDRLIQNESFCWGNFSRDIRANILCAALKNNSFDFVDRLIQDRSFWNHISDSAFEQTDFLCEALEKNYPEIVDRLIQNESFCWDNLSVDIRDAFLLLALRNNRSDIVEQIIQNESFWNHLSTISLFNILDFSLNNNLSATLDRLLQNKEFWYEIPPTTLAKVLNFFIKNSPPINDPSMEQNERFWYIINNIIPKSQFGDVFDEFLRISDIDMVNRLFQNERLWISLNIKLSEIFYYALKNHHFKSVDRLIQNESFWNKISLEERVKIYLFCQENCYPDIKVQLASNENFWNHIPVEERGEMISKAYRDQTEVQTS